MSSFYFSHFTLIIRSAPETYEENKVSLKSDVWSLGIVLFELFSYGKDPYVILIFIFHYNIHLIVLESLKWEIKKLLIY